MASAFRRSARVRYRPKADIEAAASATVVGNFIIVAMKPLLLGGRRTFLTDVPRTNIAKRALWNLLLAPSQPAGRCAAFDRDQISEDAVKVGDAGGEHERGSLGRDAQWMDQSQVGATLQPGEPNRFGDQRVCNGLRVDQVKGDQTIDLKIGTLIFTAGNAISDQAAEPASVVPSDQHAAAWSCVNQREALGSPPISVKIRGAELNEH